VSHIGTDENRIGIIALFVAIVVNYFLYYCILNSPLMKKSVLLVFLFCFSFLFSFSQNPLVKQWDKRFGGTGGEELTSIQQTNDGGYILGGWSQSGIGGDKTQPSQGNLDYWIVKTDSVGNKQWDRDFGGDTTDVLNSIRQTADRGYILGGSSLSAVGGDKTQSSQGYNDYWIVKTDSLGNKQWDKDFGGTYGDALSTVLQTIDGGYILGGSSASGAGGDKTQASQGGWDYWIVKTDSLGNKQWDKDFGGTGDDLLNNLKQTTDGGYILGGHSYSGTGGDKTQPTRGTYDYWIIKTDSLGNKLWDKDFGGNDVDYLYSIQQTKDGGYILGGTSGSTAGGDKSQPTKGLNDYWIVKTDSLGNKDWDKDYGGSDYEDGFGSVVQTKDGGYILAGTSYSPVSGDKTENNLGQEQTWVVKMDSIGNKQWDKTVFTNTGTNDDEVGFAIQTKDGCYLFANWTVAGTGGYKTQPSQGSYDYWIVKFCDTAIVASSVCSCSGALGPELVVNGDFSAGNTGFTSPDYLFTVIDLNAGYYGVDSNAHIPNGNWKPCHDHTTGNGEFLWVDASSSLSGAVFWTETITVTPNTDYVFSFWFDNLDVANLNVGPIQVFINNVAQGNQFTPPHNDSSCIWLQNCITWNSGSDTSAVISMKTMSAFFLGYDFGIDDISFRSCNVNNPVANFTSSDTVFCNEAGECINFTDHSTGNPTSWQWTFTGGVPSSSTQQNPDSICYYQPGSYPVTLIVSNSGGTDTLIVSPLIVLTSPPQAPIITYSGDTLYCSHAAHYQWYLNGVLIPNAIDSFYIASNGGTYSVQISDGNGCNSLSSGIAVGVDELSSGRGVDVYPNPASQSAVISWQSAVNGNIEVVISNVLGEIVYTMQTAAWRLHIKIDVSAFPSGVYILKINSASGVVNKKIIISGN